MVMADMNDTSTMVEEKKVDESIRQACGIGMDGIGISIGMDDDHRYCGSSSVRRRALGDDGDDCDDHDHDVGGGFGGGEGDWDDTDTANGFVSKDLQAAFEKAQNILDRNHASTIIDEMNLNRHDRHLRHKRSGCQNHHRLGPEEEAPETTSSSSSSSSTTTAIATDEEGISSDDDDDDGHDDCDGSVGLPELWEQLASVHESDVVLLSPSKDDDDPSSGKRNNACANDGRQYKECGVLLSPATGTTSGCTGRTNSRSPSTTASGGGAAAAATVVDMDVPYTLYDHYTYLKMSQPFDGRLGFAVTNNTRTADITVGYDSTTITTANATGTGATSSINSSDSDRDRLSMIPSVFELCQPVSTGTLNRVFFGLQPFRTTTMATLIPTEDGQGNSWPLEERTPFRIVLISNIRPDVHCGEIMNDILNAVIDPKDEKKQVDTCNMSERTTAVHLLKRQSGHLRAVVLSPSSDVIPQNQEDGRKTDANQKSCCYGDYGGGTSSFVFDAQLCVEREGPYQRFLCIRLYHPTEEEIVEAKDSSTPSLELDWDLLSIRPIDRREIDDLLLWESTALVKLIRAREVVPVTAAKSDDFNDQENESKTNVVWQDSPFPTAQSVSSPKSATAFLRKSMSESGRGSSRNTRPRFFSLSHQNKREKTQKKAKVGRVNDAFPALMDKTFQLIKTTSAVVLNGIITFLDMKKYSFCEGGSKLDDHFCYQIMMMTKEKFLMDGGKNKVINALKKKLLTIQERSSEFEIMLLARLASLGDVTCTLMQGRTAMTRIAEFEGFEDVIECPPMRFESDHQSYHDLCTVTNQRYVEVCRQKLKDSYEFYIKKGITQINNEEEMIATICEKFVKSSSLSNVATRQATDLVREMGNENSTPIIFLHFDVDNGQCFVLQDRFIFVERRRSVVWKKKVSISTLENVDLGDGNSLKIMDSKGHFLHLHVGPTHEATDIINFIHTMNHLVSRSCLNRALTI